MPVLRVTMFKYFRSRRGEFGGKASPLDILIASPPSFVPDLDSDSIQAWMDRRLCRKRGEALRYRPSWGEKKFQRVVV